MRSVCHQLTSLWLHQEQESQQEPRPDPMSMSFLTSAASSSPLNQETARQKRDHSRSPRSQSPFEEIPIKKEHKGEREWDKFRGAEGRVRDRSPGVESPGPLTFSQMLQPGQINDLSRSMAKGTLFKLSTQAQAESCYVL